VAIGLNALGANTTGNNNVGVGVNVLTGNTTASNNTAIGYDALTTNTTGAANTASELMHSISIQPAMTTPQTALMRFFTTRQV